MYTCKNCGKEFLSIQSYAGHMSKYSRKPKNNQKIITQHICKFCGREFISGQSLGSHIRLCNKNPKYLERIEKMRICGLGRAPSDKTKKKLSESMKKAHKEGRAWNIGKSRWNNKQSYPEIFFEKVINNEFVNKNFKSEYPVSIYSLDFAWIDLKKAIEIDGAQHQRFKEYIERDIRKDEYLKNNGWEILRVKWKDMYNNTKDEIMKCKIFIDGIK